MAYSPKEREKLQGEVCALIRDGKSLREIESVKGMPSRPTILRWLDEDENFQAQYARAKQVQAEALFDELHAIAADKSLPVDRARLMWDSRRWEISKMAPRRYGDKLQVEHEAGPNLAAVLAEANARRARIAAPMRHLGHDEQREIIDVTATSERIASDCKSDGKPRALPTLSELFDDSDD